MIMKVCVLNHNSLLGALWVPQWTNSELDWRWQQCPPFLHDDCCQTGSSSQGCYTQGLSLCRNHLSCQEKIFEFLYKNLNQSYKSDTKVLLCLYFQGYEPEKSVIQEAQRLSKQVKSSSAVSMKYRILLFLWSVSEQNKLSVVLWI